jgi:anti-anti-sigma factor
MAFQIRPQGAVFVDLPGGSELQEKLQEVAELVRNRTACDIVMDFSRVTIFNSICLAALLRLRQQLRQCGRRLILGNVGAAAYRVFSTTGLTEMFEITESTSDAPAATRSHAMATGE